LENRYQVLSTDVAEGDQVITADVTDLYRMREVCEGIDTVVHLAGDRRITAGFDTLLPLNLVGPYNVFQAANECGCRRVIFASSIHAVTGYGPAHAAAVDVPVNPTTLYGVSKCYGEALGRYYANQGLSTICIRVGAVVEPAEAAALPEELHQAWISYRDLAQLIQRCVEAEGIEFATVHGLSRHAMPRLDISQTCELLGYEPQDGTVGKIP
jgi:nucleoside-diphosphate-sugar epimerase